MHSQSENRSLCEKQGAEEKNECIVLINSNAVNRNFSDALFRFRRRERRE